MISKSSGGFIRVVKDGEYCYDENGKYTGKWVKDGLNTDYEPDSTFIFPSESNTHPDLTEEEMQSAK